MNHTYDTTFKLYIYKDKQNKMHFKELSNSAKKIKSARGLGGGGGKGRRGGGRERGEIPECERVKCKLEQFEDVRLYTMSFQLLFYSKT